jgi:hypothetical protein
LPDRLLLVAIAVAIVTAGAFVYVSYSPSPGGTGTTQNPIVPADQIVSGGPSPDVFPSIDNPKFTNETDASSWLTDSYDAVIGVSLNGDVRAYPLRIMVWHEIANDVVGGVPVAITYCPLCYSTQAFIRQINGTAVQFGTSGKLYNNNLVMYDRLTKSLWSEIWGEAIAGSMTGQTLQRVPIDVTTWGAWKNLHPNTLVLSMQTGFTRDYSDDPYGNYYYTSGVYFPLSHLDGRLPPKTVVLGVTVGASFKAYRLNSPWGQGAIAYTLANQTSPLLTDSVGGRPVLVWESGQVVRFFNPLVNGVQLTFKTINGNIVDSETHTAWNFDGTGVSGPLKGQSMTRYVSETAFWFAWAVFYPDTTIYSSQ